MFPVRIDKAAVGADIRFNMWMKRYNVDLKRIRNLADTDDSIYLPLKKRQSAVRMLNHK